LGQPGISSFTDGTAEAEVVSGLYDIAKEDALASYFWKFATKEEEIAEVTSGTAQLVGWDAMYLEPTDAIRIVRVADNVAYQRAQGRIYTNASSPIAVMYVINVNEGSFPPYFVNAFVQQLSADFCMALTEDTSRTMMYERKAASAWQRARHIDSTTQPAASFKHAIVTGINNAETTRP
jgi:hypothetical protein